MCKMCELSNNTGSAILSVKLAQFESPKYGHSIGLATQVIVGDSITESEPFFLELKTFDEMFQNGNQQYFNNLARIIFDCHLSVNPDIADTLVLISEQFINQLADRLSELWNRVSLDTNPDIVSENDSYEWSDALFRGIQNATVVDDLERYHTGLAEYH